MTPTAIFQSLRKYVRQSPAAVERQEGREFTIDELARAADTTVRNVRAYQDRGLLPPPEKRGRTGIYSDVHLARLRIISQLLNRGFTLANIRDLLTAWEQGRDLNDILGLEVVVTSPWSDEAPSYISYEELLEYFGDHLTQEVLLKAVNLGYIIPEGDRLRVPSPRVLSAGRELVAAGIPLEALLDEVNKVRYEVDRIAEGFVRLVTTHLIDKKYGENDLPRGEDVPNLAHFIQRVRPLADMVVSAELARILDKSINKVLVDRLANVLTHLEQQQSENTDA
ncbi:hypothetical protein A167_02248 [Alcanivorax sp. S71-1-4]|nr:hypothetical protein A167_02248 [Alcanivorax sp. S71-1-4]